MPEPVPLLLYLDPTGAERRVALHERPEPLTLGRRAEADVCLPWDLEVSRLHAELLHVAGEWVLADEGLSQNGTFVNGMRMEGRRRLRDGDLVTLGRTTLTFCDPRASGAQPTLASADLRPALLLSEQQQLVLRALCRPLVGDGVGVEPARDDQVATDLGLPPEVVATELDLLARAFGYDDLPRPERRRRVALVALRSGLTRADDTP